MQTAEQSKAAVPLHVPQERVVDWDFYHIPGAEQDVHLAWKSLHDGPDIFWTPRNGGHWVMTRGEDILRTQREPEIFSFAEVTVPRVSKPLKLVPLELDPPQHTGYRTIINELFAPRFVQSLEGDIRQLTVELIEGFRAKGECEFVADFAKQLPIVIFLRMMGLPLGDQAMLLQWTEASVRASVPEERMLAFQGVYGYLEEWIAERQARPGDDMISRVVQAQVNGRPLNHEELHQMLTILLFGGLDTVASGMGFMARFLAEHPAHRLQLIEQPELIPHAVDEMLRRFGVSTTGRIIAKDVLYKDVQFRRGDVLHIFGGLHGMDERIFPDPMTVDFRRRNGPHVTFGNGVHRCPGALLARTEMRIFLREWLQRIPDFRIKPGGKVVTGSGMVNGVLQLPLVWEVAG